MFRDRQQELERLRDELLEEEEQEVQVSSQEDDDLLSDEMLNQLLGIEVHSYNADRVDLDPQKLSEEVLKPEEPKLTGLLVTAGLLTAGIFLVVLWWVLRYMGVL